MLLSVLGWVGSSFCFSKIFQKLAMRNNVDCGFFFFFKKKWLTYIEVIFLKDWIVNTSKQIYGHVIYANPLHHISTDGFHWLMIILTSERQIFYLPKFFVIEVSSHFAKGNWCGLYAVEKWNWVWFVVLLFLVFISEWMGICLVFISSDGTCHQHCG